MSSRAGWLPQTPRQKLVKIDTLLAGIIPRFTDTRERIVDVLPGHSGRPAGNGEPPGGSGGGGATVVERVVLGPDLANDDPGRDARTPVRAEQRALDQMDHLARMTVERVEALTRRVGCKLGPVPDLGMVRRLVWARWAVRVVEQLNPARLPDRLLDSLWFDLEALDHICIAWGPPRSAPSAREVELAADPTENYCRSHLRIGAREHRSDRYPTDGLCRPCGDFLAEHGWLPTLEILDALQSGMHGSTIAKMIRDEHERRRKAKTTKKPRRRRRR